MFEEHGVFKVLTRPLNPPDLNLIEHLCDMLENYISLIHGGHIAADVLVLDTTGHFQRSVKSMYQQVRVVLVVQGVPIHY